MSIGRTWEESLQKALRMVDTGIEGFEPRGNWAMPGALDRELTRPTDLRIYAIAYALKHKVYTVDQLHAMTAIDKWFLYRLDAINAESERVIAAQWLSALSADDLRKAKQAGFSDRQIASRLAGVAPPAPGVKGPKAAGAKPTYADVRKARKAAGVTPFVKQIDTLAAEYPAQTNYLYTTYHGSEHDVSFGDKGVMVLGSGTYRIGSSVEFDWCAVSAIRTLRHEGRKTIVVNYNPETVSTDFDECDRLYFEELSLERVLDIYEAEQADGVIVSVGGQIPNNLALPLHKHGVKILGTSAESIDSAEDRGKFSALMDSIGVRQPAWRALTSLEDAVTFANHVTYVLSGAAMNVAHTDEALIKLLGAAAAVSPEHPVVITKFLEGALEIEFDGVASGGNIVAHAISEHVEQAGVHSGDATLILPPQNLSPYYIDRVKDIAAKVRRTSGRRMKRGGTRARYSLAIATIQAFNAIDTPVVVIVPSTSAFRPFSRLQVAKALNITGPFNMQLLAKDADVLIIETNLRASRSFPFVSKTVGSDFIAAATRVMLGIDVSRDGLPDLTAAMRPTRYVGIKAPMFSFTRLRGADPVLGVEMASTGEVSGERHNNGGYRLILQQTSSMHGEGRPALTFAPLCVLAFVRAGGLLWRGPARGLPQGAGCRQLRAAQGGHPPHRGGA